MRKLSIVVMLILLAVSCKKEKVDQNSTVQPKKVNSGVNQVPNGTNYCEGCGNSNDKGYRCMPVSEPDPFNPTGPFHTITLCAGEVCLVAQTNDPTIQPQSFSLPNLDINTGHNFRDNFLENSTIGKQYIDYYYDLSQYFIINDLLTTSNFYDCYNFATSTYSVAATLTNGNNQDIAITSTYKQEALDMINYVRTTNPNQNIVEILDTIEDDLDIFVGKTNAEIQTLIQ